jgi:Flp pilus assembly protein TadD
MSELVTAQSCFEAGLQAYRTGDFNFAVTSFLLGLEKDKTHWEMRLYLGMAYCRVGSLREAKNEFITVRDFSPDSELRRKANAAFQAMAPTASQTGIKKLSS